MDDEFAAFMSEIAAVEKAAPAPGNLNSDFTKFFMKISQFLHFLTEAWNFLNETGNETFCENSVFDDYGLKNQF